MKKPHPCGDAVFGGGIVRSEPVDVFLAVEGFVVERCGTAVAAQQGELAVGQYAEVIYDGKMTRSIPAQIAALAINVYPLKGTVDAVEEDGRVLVTPADGGEQVVLSLPDGVTMEAGETATFYTNGMATMSIPAQMNAIGVVK